MPVKEYPGVLGGGGLFFMFENLDVTANEETSQ